jgi:hypothetical protein
MRGVFRSAITLGLVLLLPALSAAVPPVAPVPVAPKGVLEGTTHAFSWRAVPGATSYQLYIRDALVNPKLQEWYTADQLGCTSGEGVCTVIISTDLAVGRGFWRVRGSNLDGVGAFTTFTAFTLRHVPKSWDTALPASERFQLILADQAVLDRETGLVWQRSEITQSTVSWVNASYFCTTYATGTAQRRGWRLPTLDELQSLLDPGQPAPGPLLPPGHPFVNIFAGVTWTATPYGGGTTYYWYVDLSNGNVGPITPGSLAHYWCVRGQAGDARD